MGASLLTLAKSIYLFIHLFIYLFIDSYNVQGREQ